MEKVRHRGKPNERVGASPGLCTDDPLPIFSQILIEFCEYMHINKGRGWSELQMLKSTTEQVSLREFQGLASTVCETIPAKISLTSPLVSLKQERTEIMQASVGS